jgi:formate C-acetyltransferase
LGDGSGPAQGREKKGPTASILSSTKWEHYPFIGGIAVNMKFGHIFDKYNIEKLMNIVEIFMQRGGFELQINVVDSEKLKKAMETPELYQDIVVRVGGYSDFFVRLSKTMQKEVIERTEHGI